MLEGMSNADSDLILALGTLVPVFAGAFWLQITPDNDDNKGRLGLAFGVMVGAVLQFATAMVLCLIWWRIHT